MTSDFSIWEDLHTFVGTEVSLANEFKNYVDDTVSDGFHITKDAGYFIGKK